MEAKLAAYRAEKQKQFEAQKRGEWLSGAYSRATGLLKRTRETHQNQPTMELPEEEASERLLSPTPPPSHDLPQADLYSPSSSSWTWIDLMTLACKVGLYLTFFGISCHYELGAAYVVVTAFPVMYFSTSTRGRRPGEVSAYSVFNPGCEAIDGTLTGEQFQREIMYGPGAT